jgi:hypothetical protein
MGSGYLLVYIRQCDAPWIFEPIDESVIPLHLKDFVRSQGDRDELPDQELTVSVALEDGARENGLHCKVGFQNELVTKQFVFHRSRDSNETVYTKFSELFEIPVGEIRLWTCYSQFFPWIVFDNSPSISLVLMTYPTLLLQRKPVDEPLHFDSDSITIFIKFFHPEIPGPIRYLGTQLMSKSALVKTLFPVIAEQLHFPDDSEFLVFQENISGGAVTIDPERSIDASAFAVLIFQLPKGVSLPESDEWTAAAPAEIDETQLQEMSYRKTMCEESETVAEFLQRTIHAVLYNDDARTTPLAKIVFPESIPVTSLRQFALRAAGFTLDIDTDTVLLYSGTRQSPAPSELMEYSGEVAARFARAGESASLFIRVIRGLTKQQLASHWDTTIGIVETACLSPRQIRRFLPPAPTFREIRDRLVAAGDLPDVPDLRFWTTSPSQLYREITDWATHLQRYETVRVDIVPEEERELGPSETLSVVGIVDLAYVIVLPPFHFVIKADEAGDDVVVRLLQKIGIDADDSKKVSVVVSTKKNPLAADVVPVEGTKTLAELLEGKTARKSKAPKLFVVVHENVHRVQAHRHRQVPLRIFN